MMDMINGFDNATAIMGGSSSQLPAGVYVGKIVSVKLGKSRAGDEMLTLAMDIADGEYKDFYRNVFDRKKQYKKEGEEIKWPCQYYQLTRKDEQTIGRFKGLITCIEMSNDGYKWNWEETSLRGKLCGCIFREEEYIGNDNKKHTATRCYAIIPIAEMENATVPEKKTVDAPASNGFDSFNEEMIPF